MTAVAQPRLDDRAARHREQAREAQHRYRSGGRPVWILHRFPVTVLLSTPYFLLFLPEALLFGNPDLTFILVTFGCAVVGSLCVELFALSRVRPGEEPRWSVFVDRASLTWRAGVIAGTVGGLSGVVAAAAGVGSVASQVSGTTVSAQFTALSIFASWNYIATALFAASYLGGRLTRRQLLVATGFLVAAEAVRSYLTTITASLVSFFCFAVLLLFYVGVVRLRWCITVALVVMLLWPTVFSLRNAARTDFGVAVDANVSAWDRIRYDLQIGSGAGLPVPIDVGQPQGLELVRYGLIPRVLDPSRPSIRTGSQINVILGGSDTSSTTFLPVATLYVLEGPSVTIGYYAAIAVFVSFLLRQGTRASPARLVVFALLLQGAMGWFGTYPDDFIGTLQGVVAFLPLAAVLGLGYLSRHRLEQPHPPQHHGRGRSFR